mmetsp:Transcript_10343/g.34214  ORF Transcript_10343/g.34214 Transcript_10343/m.34214 type:complete len:248 (-) Transcript_10343:1112-1855(-)
MKPRIEARLFRPPSISRGAIRVRTAHRKSATRFGGVKDPRRDFWLPSVWFWFAVRFDSSSVSFCASRVAVSAISDTVSAIAEPTSSSPKSIASVSEYVCASSSAVRSTRALSAFSKSVGSAFSRSSVASNESSMKSFSIDIAVSPGTSLAVSTTARPPPPTPRGIGQCKSSSAPYGHLACLRSMRCSNGSRACLCFKGIRRTSRGLKTAPSVPECDAFLWPSVREARDAACVFVVLNPVIAGTKMSP